VNILEWMCTPIRVYKEVRQELRLLRGENRVKLAHLNADIQNGKITGDALDAVTECLEAQSVQIRKKETRHLNGSS
jgi:hypothetical protein